jgi:hypothetical protein
MQSRKKSTTDQPYAQAEKMILSRMKNPVRFTEFLTECVTWISERETAVPNEIANVTFLVTRLINDLNVPLYIGHKEVIEKGFNNFLDCYGPRGYHDELGVLMECFGKSADAGYPGLNHWQLFTDGIGVLMDLYPILMRQWEIDKENNPNLELT